jgi:uncharacterized coiled-coil protein SlyX
MNKAEAIYTWWVRLPLWARIPLALVLPVALVALVVGWVVKDLRVPAPDPHREALEARVSEAEHSAARLERVVAEADAEIDETREEMENANEELQDVESAIVGADSFDRVDELVAEHVERSRRGAGGGA